MLERIMEWWSTFPVFWQWISSSLVLALLVLGVFALALGTLAVLMFVLVNQPILGLFLFFFFAALFLTAGEFYNDR